MLKKLIGGYFLAQFRIMFVVAVILVVGFLVLGIRYAFLIGVLVAILDFLPLFGTGTDIDSMGRVQAFIRRLCVGCGTGTSLCTDTGHPPGHPA